MPIDGDLWAAVEPLQPESPAAPYEARHERGDHIGKGRGDASLARRTIQNPPLSTVEIAPNAPSQQVSSKVSAGGAVHSSPGRP